MKTKLSILIFIAINFCFKSYSGGDKFELKLILSPTFETMRPGNRFYKDNWGYKLSYNYGLEYKLYFERDVSISTGLMFQNKGYRVVLDKNKNPSPVYKNSVFYTNFNYIIVPTNLNFHFEPSNKTRFLIAIGLSNGYLLNARGIYKRVSDDDLSVIKDGNSNLDPEDNSFNMLPYSYRRFTGVNLGFKFSKYIFSKMIIEFGAIYCRQLNRSSRETDAVDQNGLRFVVRPKFDSYILDLRIGYFFNKQIKNSGKNF